MGKINVGATTKLSNPSLAQERSGILDYSSSSIQCTLLLGKDEISILDDFSTKCSMLTNKKLKKSIVLRALIRMCSDFDVKEIVENIKSNFWGYIINDIDESRISDLSFKLVNFYYDTIKDYFKILGTEDKISTLFLSNSLPVIEKIVESFESFIEISGMKDVEGSNQVLILREMIKDTKHNLLKMKQFINSLYTHQTDNLH